jgi:DNA-binding transcriptional MocR family regulator
MPLTQELLADALGLSVVHINRTMQKLRAKGYITLRAGSITLHGPQQLARVACYEPPPALPVSIERPQVYELAAARSY